MSFDILARLLGGIGLFLLGMRLMTEGLRVAAGQALRNILSRSTQTRLRGVASGALVTSLVQSSSAITVATIGFVNAGLLSLSQALAITYGSNIGTTMTGWLVAALGFQMNIKAFALPLIGVGMALRLGARAGRIGPLGEALAGFGVFFMGIEVLRGAFEGLGDQLELAALVGAGPLQVLMVVAIGFGLTVLMQSSSAAIAVILTATGGGVIPLGTGAALVVGANVGTTSTAALAVIGATPNAKRVAGGHVAFNVITGGVALLLLPVLLLLIARGRDALELGAEPVAVLAAFHTLFNLLGVALLWPLTPRLVAFLERRFRTAEEDEATPRYLDRHVLSTPRLALDAMVMELTRAGQIVRRIARLALSKDKRAASTVSAGREALERLLGEVGAFTQLLQRTRIPPELDELLPTTLRVSRYYLEAAELAASIAETRGALVPIESAELQQEVDDFVRETEALAESVGLELEDYDVDAVASRLALLEEHYAVVKASLLEAGAHAAMAVHDLVATLDWLSNLRRMAQQLERGARSLDALAIRDEDGNDPEIAAPAIEAV